MVDGLALGLTAAIWEALGLTLRLAAVTTLILLVCGGCLAYVLARFKFWGKSLLEVLVALPLVLPPTVLGFYLLLLLAPTGAVGGVWQALGLPPLVFSFTGLVLGSCLYSLPFVVQPLQNAFATFDRGVEETMIMLGAGPCRIFWQGMVPASRRAILTAAVMGFAHTVGEFGVVLMIGGNIPGATRVVSIALYDQVEAMDYAGAHRLALLLLLLSALALGLLYGPWRGQPSQRSA